MATPHASGSELAADIDADLRSLIDEYRGRRLWFLRPDYYPTEREAILRVLDSIECHGDRQAYRRSSVTRR